MVAGERCGLLPGLLRPKIIMTPPLLSAKQVGSSICNYVVVYWRSKTYEIAFTLVEVARFVKVKLAVVIVDASIAREKVAVTADKSGETLVAPLAGDVETTVTGAGS